MNEFTLGIYHFKGTRFPLALSAFTWKTNRVGRGGWGLTLASTPGLGNEKQTKEKGRVCLLPSGVLREKAICVSTFTCKVYFTSRLMDEDPRLFSRGTDKAIIDKLEERD